MNKKFMGELYDKIYEDPVYEIVQEHKKYRELNKMRSTLQEKYEDLVSDEQMKLHDEIIDIINLQINIIAKEMYLRGMEDPQSIKYILDSVHLWSMMCCSIADIAGFAFAR